MPHKHKRQKINDGSDYNLPPTSPARPLPVTKRATTSTFLTPSTTKSALKRKRASAASKTNGFSTDDTPRAFTRLLNFANGVKPRSGLDDGTPRPKGTKKKKSRKDTNHDENDGYVSSAALASERRSVTAPGHPESKPATVSAAHTPTTDLPLRILPHEPLSSFAQRVNASLPISGLTRKGTRAIDKAMGLKVKQTKNEKKMQRMQAEWREGYRRRKEQREEELEEEEMDRVVDGGQGGREGGGSGDNRSATGGTGVGSGPRFEDVVGSGTGKKAKRKLGGGGKKKKSGGGGNENEKEDEYDSEGDPWAVIKKIRAEEERKAGVEGGGLVGLHDVVQAPPQFRRVPSEKFQAADVPNRGANLRAREELGAARREVVSGYRKMMGREVGLRV
ncbi:hypothetical protein MMC25_004884 [Agyrium rufum]|nr:hypothetical protein [Agyrium rufum]